VVTDARSVALYRNFQSLKHNFIKEISSLKRQLDLKTAAGRQVIDVNMMPLWLLLLMSILRVMVMVMTVTVSGHHMRHRGSRSSALFQLADRFRCLA
jgi:hypothetical protein